MSKYSNAPTDLHSFLASFLVSVNLPKCADCVRRLKPKRMEIVKGDNGVLNDLRKRFMHDILVFNINTHKYFVIRHALEYDCNMFGRAIRSTPLHIKDMRSLGEYIMNPDDA
nr:uncharacterized protein LOC109164944 [Ipomoea batatas]GMD82417.1 uncharacterized protein LOC109164944 [Ipomoea batatas]